MTKKISRIFVLLLVVSIILNINLLTVNSESTVYVDISIDTSLDKKLISSYIYGINYTSDLSETKFGSIKQGGSRFTTYNWESNFSNAGSVFFNTNDNGLVTVYPIAEQKSPALAVDSLINMSEKNKIPYMVTTIPLSDYVSADANGPVLSDQTAPSQRWLSYIYKKSTPFSSTPDQTDETVYADEYINYLITKYGSSTSQYGVRGYALDNDTGMWNTNHPSIFITDNSIAGFIRRTVDMSKIIKGLDPHAMVFGGQLGGLDTYTTFNNASDWEVLSERNNWFIDYYLSEMKKAGQSYGKRLVDVLDLYYYSEAKASNSKQTIVESTKYDDVDSNNVRVQAPRIFWDSTYKENSSVYDNYQQYMPLIPTIQASINKNYSGTKLAFSEYNFGGGAHISGAIAEADTLGIFGREGVYLACLNTDDDNISYQKSAINLFTNYDGNGSAFGNTSVKAETSDSTAGSVYASTENADDSKLKIILINKSADSKQLANISIKSSIYYDMSEIYVLDGTSSKIRSKNSHIKIANNQFTYKLDPMSIVEIVLVSNGETTGIKTDTEIISESVFESDESAVESETINSQINTEISNKPVNSSENNETSYVSTTEITNNNESNDPFMSNPSKVPLGLKIAVYVLATLTGIGIIYVIITEFIAIYKNKR